MMALTTAAVLGKHHNTGLTLDDDRNITPPPGKKDTPPAQVVVDMQDCPREQHLPPDAKARRDLRTLFPDLIRQLVERVKRSRGTEEVRKAMLFVLRLNELELSTQQEVLLYAALNRDNTAVVDYKEREGKRVTQKYIHSEEELVQGTKRFLFNPKGFQETCRKNLLEITADQRMPLDKRLRRLERYVDAYFDLICKLDSVCFKHDPSKVYQGVPSYLPDGFSDMGSSPELDETERDRDKIGVNKREIFAQAKPLFMKILGEHISDKQEIAQLVALWVYEHMPFDYKTHGENLRGKSVLVHEHIDAEEPQAVCRHQAVYAQVLLQALGLNARLLKCDLEGGPHSANLVRIYNQWHILDVTNTRVLTDGPRVFMPPIDDRHIDLNKQTYSWRVAYGITPITYRSRNNMFYRVK